LLVGRALRVLAWAGALVVPLVAALATLAALVLLLITAQPIEHVKKSATEVTKRIKDI
jgi:hypothetical protein